MENSLLKISRIGIPLLLIGTLFLSSDFFIDREINPKIYVFVVLSYVFGICLLLLYRRKLMISSWGITVILFILYINVDSMFTASCRLTTLCLWGFGVLLLFFTHVPISKNTDRIIVLLCVLQSVYGLLQYWNLIRNTTIYPVTGSFDNPAGFSACLSTAFPLIFLLLQNNKLYKLSGIVSGVIIGTAIVVSGSRAGIICLTISLFIYAYTRLFPKIGKLRWLLFLCLLIVGAALFIHLYTLKKDSATGRILIWRVTTDMIADKPILGGRSGFFHANYMQYQARFFELNSCSRYGLLADNINHPFNEYLYLIVEYGLIAFILFIVQVVVLVRQYHASLPYTLCLLSLVLFALFSYPLKYPFTWVIAAYCLAHFVRKKSNKTVFSIARFKGLKVVGAVFLSIGLFRVIQDIRFEYEWMRVTQVEYSAPTSEVLRQYGNLYDRWSGNYHFLYSYAALLSRKGEYEKSNEILTECQRYFDDCDVQTIVAENHYHLGNWIQAESHYLTAAHMCPNRFFPLYGLYKIYIVLNDRNKALEIADRILVKKVKIPSQTVQHIVEEMREYVRTESCK